MPELATPAATALKMRIEGMECSACALKIENALRRLRGVSDVSVNYGIETLTLRIDQDRISLGAVEQQIRALGYAPKVLDGGSVAGSKGEENLDARPGCAADKADGSSEPGRRSWSRGLSRCWIRTFHTGAMSSRR